jgi:hypothetical protein
MATKIAGFILRSRNRHETADFYAALGLKYHEHSHGGPSHYEVAPNSPDIVLEIYPGSDAYSKDAVMIEVDLIETALKAIERFGSNPQYPIKGSGKSRFIYVFDPDERPVMLIEKKK